MKTYLLPLFAAFALTVGTAAAQTTTQTTTTTTEGRGHGGHGRQQGTPEEMATRQSQRLTKELGLSAEQTAKVQQILLARGQEMQAMRGQGKDAANRDQMRETMKANHAKYDEQFKSVFTADQYTKYTALQADRMKHGRGDHAKGQDGKLKTKESKLKAKDGKVKIKKTNG
ncbi:MAG: hypothetical protein JWR44_2608 [Hymenobacter sp.]|jgi:protein CpxP|nr:hypothetical protein [Hymenobacter sp.]